MVRWKTPRRLKRRRVAGENYEFSVDESLKENEEESEEDDGEDDSSTQRIRCDGEHEDNYRDPMIRMGYFSLTIFSFFFNPFAVGLSFWLEWSVCSEKSDYQELQEEKEEYGLLSPTMSTILEINQSKFKQEIKFLKECNASLTSSTLINAGFEMLSLSYSLLVFLILKDIHYSYPLFQLLFHFLLRCNYKNLYRSPLVTPRFHGPIDIALAMTVDLGLSLVDWTKFEGHLISHLCVFRPCPIEIFLVPMILSLFQFFGRTQHDYLYSSERLMRKHIREKYNQHVALLHLQ